MKLRFKVQPYQTSAVEAVADCFAGQVKTSGVQAGQGFRNAGLHISESALLENIRNVQRRQNLPLSDKLVRSAGCGINLDVEMETGTGKTYCYIKTIFELNRRFGWTRFIVVVPSIAIREGVYKSFEITADHFAEAYGRKARFFIYDSGQLHHLAGFSADAGVNVMIINVQAFNATGRDNRRIYDELDEFQSRRPVDVISGSRPIVILDEPQKMEGARTMEALSRFEPLMILRYSATHRTVHNRVHRLDALDAYNQKLVKKIAVRGIGVKGLAGTGAYLYLESVEISRNAPLARIELEVRRGTGVKRVVKRLGRGADLFAESNGLEPYRGFVIAQIDANSDTVEFTNGQVLRAGEPTGDVTEATLRRIQIREAIEAHLEKERRLFSEGVKVLSLFFIDQVVKYRDYGRSDEEGEYARIFEEEYEQLKAEYLRDLPLEDGNYRAYLAGIDTARTHSGYFSIDRKTGRLADPCFKRRGDEAGLSEDADAYDLILKDRERLLSFQEPVRFIFSHSALREGWDNPNVFVLCMLKHSDSAISRRQEVGRGLRLCVNQQGERMDGAATVHDINILTVVAAESYRDFVARLQREVGESLSERPGVADGARFPGKPQLPVADERAWKVNPLNANFHGREFRELWRRINRKAVYRVEFDSAELIRESIQKLDEELRVSPLRYTLQKGEQAERATYAGLKAGEGFGAGETAAEEYSASFPAKVKYDLPGRLAEKTQLTRKSIAAILCGLKAATFEQFRQNPEEFIAGATRLINERKAAVITERVRYELLEERHGIDIFSAGQGRQDFGKASEKLGKHICDYVIADTEEERRFAKALDSSEKVLVYAKLPKSFLIPTPVGDYHPGWAISLRDGPGRRICFVADVQDCSMPDGKRRALEEKKIECARKFFEEINRRIAPEQVMYDVVTSCEELIETAGSRNLQNKPAR